jgi:hypothetical protein
MQFFINDEEIDVTLENEKNAGDILRGFEAELEESGATIINIELNGNTIPAEEIDSLSLIPINEVEILKLTVLAQSDIMRSFKEISTTFREFAPKLEDIPVLLQTGKDNQVHALVKKFADTFDSFCRTVTLSSLFPEEFCSMTIAGQDISSFLAEFSPILADFETALTDHDTVLIGDLAEYEIMPRLLAIAESGERL